MKITMKTAKDIATRKMGKNQLRYTGMTTQVATKEDRK
jgi:hypothetical protein